MNPAVLRRHRSTLEDLPLYLPRMYYALLGLLERRLAESGLDAHLRPGMGHVLLALYEEDDCIIRDIGRRVQITNGTLTGLLQRMEQARLVECRQCPEDRRAVRVRLTPLGRGLEPRIRRFHDGITRTMQEGLSRGDIEQAHQLFEHLLASLRKDDEAPPRPPRDIPRRRVARARTKPRTTTPK